MLVQLGAVFFTYHAAERSAYSIPADIYSHVAMEQQRLAAERLSEVFRGEWCYCSRYCSGILEACCLQPNGMSLGEILSGWRDLNSRPLDPQTSAARPSTSTDVRFPL